MKRIFFIGLILPTFLSAFGQGPGEFGFFAGPQATSVKYTINNKEQQAKHKYGFHAGGIFKVPFEKKLFFSPALFYSLKGYKVTLKAPSFPPNTLAKDNNTIIHTIELGTFLQYDFREAPGSFFIRGGTSADFAFSGKEEFNLPDGSVVNQKMKFSFEDYGRFTASGIIMFGYETASRFMTFAYYAHGMGSMNNADGGPKIKHRIIGISIGKYFRNRKIIIDTRNKE